MNLYEVKLFKFMANEQDKMWLESFFVESVNIGKFFLCKAYHETNVLEKKTIPCFCFLFTFTKKIWLCDKVCENFLLKNFKEVGNYGAMT